MATGHHVQQHAQQTDVQQATAYSAQQAVLLFINTQNYFCNGEGPLRQAALLQQLQVGRPPGSPLDCLTAAIGVYLTRLACKSDFTVMASDIIDCTLP